MIYNAKLHFHPADFWVWALAARPDRGYAVAAIVEVLTKSCEEPSVMDHRGGYRGADLDLRTARTWSATSTDLMSGFEVPSPPPPQAAPAPSHRTNPIWVDETVLAAANHAFEVAQAHGAREVRLEHLLHALTRVEAAASTLELRGVRVVPLRRDTAVLIASDIPVGLSAGGGSPHRSHELEETLRLAAAHAAHAGRPAGVDDVLHVLLDLRNDHPAGELLLRHLSRASRDFWNPLGVGRAPYGLPVHLVEVSDAERMRNASGTAYLAGGQPRLTEGGAGWPEVLDRLGAIERVVSDRLVAVETTLANVPAVTPLDLQAIKERLELIEEAVLAREGDGAVVERLSALGRLLQEERIERANAFDALAADVKALAGALGGSGSDGQGSVAERLQQLVADLEQHRNELGSSLDDRIAAIEKSLAAQGEKVAEAHTAYSEELAEVHEALMKLNVNQHTLAGSLEQWRSNEAGEIYLINARIGAVQEDGTKRLQVLERLSQDMTALARAGEEKLRRGFGYWLFGTDDWVKAGWQKRAKPKA